MVFEVNFLSEKNSWVFFCLLINQVEGHQVLHALQVLQKECLESISNCMETFQECLKMFQSLLKLYGVWKRFRVSKNIPEYPETFPDCLVVSEYYTESFNSVRNLSRVNGKFFRGFGNYPE